MYLLGFDIGSSFIKGTLLDSDTNEEIAKSKQPSDEMDVMSRQVGWAEQMPEIWWANLCTLTKNLLTQSKVEPQEIKGIGISYQMHGLVLIDKDYQVLRPCIIWSDGRAASIGSAAFEKLGETYIQQNLLNSPGNFTISKLKWVKDNEPEIYERIYKILLPGDYINMKLTGKVNTTISGLTEGMFWNYKEKRIAYEVLHHFELDHRLIPEVTETFSVMGTITSEAAAATGLCPGTPVTYRAGDQPNNALALNIMRPGEIAATSGTSGVIYGIADKFLYNHQSKVNAFAHVNYEDNFKNLGILLCLNGAGNQYAWVKHQVALSDRTYEDMERMAASVTIGSDGICILPFGNGAERIFDNKNIGSHVFNLDFNRHKRAHIYRASLEGVAFSFVYGVRFLKEMGLDVNVIRVAKENMFQSKVFATTIATLLDANIEIVATSGAIGAARAAGVVAGTYPNIQAALNKIEIESTVFPDYNKSAYDMAYNRWLDVLNTILNKTGNPHEIKKPTQSNPDPHIVDDIEKSLVITAQTLQLESLHQVIKSVYITLEKMYLKEHKDDLKPILNKLRKANETQMKQTQSLFEVHYNEVNNQFFNFLRNKHNNLSHEELKICGLLKMKLSCKEMASILNVSVRGMETKRYRIRKKLGIGERRDIAGYLNKLL